VAVTDGDRVESQIRYGWEVNYYAIGDLVKEIAALTDAEIDAKMKEYTDKYTMKTSNVEAVREQAKYEAALDKFLAKRSLGAFTDTFQDLYGLRQLPGIASQNLMARGVGFGPEGDYKISAFSAVLMKMAESRQGATGFIEDYTYDLTEGEELELASHMLEVPPAFAATKPEIDVIPLGIGGKEDPARLIFDGVTGDAIQVTMIDMGTHFRIICADIELVKQPQPMPKLPVARIMYRHKPNFEIGTAAWCYAGGAHHSVVSTSLTRSDIAMFARLTGTELITIGEDTTEADLQKFFMN
nr:L-arabinose isomerase [Lachnospiraceae bacterium]